MDNNKKKVKFYSALLVTVLCIIGVSYAWFRLYLSQSESNRISARTCFDTTLTEDSAKISLDGAVPESDEKGLTETPFTFTLKNNCTGYIRAYITIDSAYRTSTSTSYLKDNKIKVNISPTGTTLYPSSLLTDKALIELEGSRLGYSIIDVGLNSNEEKTFDLRVWMDSSTTVDEGLNKTWEGKIVVLTEAQNVGAPNGWNSAKDGTLLASLRNNTEISKTITIPGKEVSAHTLDDAPSQTASVSTTDQAYYITYGTGWEANGTKFNLTGTAVTSDTYANSYSSLVGKYLMSPYILGTGSSTAGEMMTTTDLDKVYYVVSATQNGFTYKQITSIKNVSEAIVASTEDDYGTSYYFRGAVKNNYVQFANKCWRIVRVGGNGSVKLILHNDNTAGAANPCNAANNNGDAAFARYSGTTYTSAFNEKFNDNAFVGLMYGNVGCSDRVSTYQSSCTRAGGTWTASTSYANAHANINKSTILTNLETWYNNNLKTYESVIDNSVWCNDKTNVTDITYNPSSYGGNATGLGYGTNKTYYGATQRLISTSGNAGGTGPSLKCNGELSKITSKVGLITADELAFAGYAGDLYNTTTYIQENATDDFWWSLSPLDFVGSGANVWGVYGKGGGFDDLGVSGARCVRPSISLKSTTNVTGEGTSENPYKVKM